MKMLFRSLFVVLVLAALVAPVSAQTTIDNTTFSTAVSSTTTNLVSLASVTCTNCTFGRDTWIYADTELMVVTGAYTSGASNIPVLRGQKGTRAGFHTTTAKVWVGPATRFQTNDPPGGACNKKSGPGTNGFYPWINVSNGYRWLCDNGQDVNTSTQLWRAVTPVGPGAPSDATAKLSLPAPKEDRGLVAEVRAYVAEFFAWW